MLYLFSDNGNMSLVKPIDTDFEMSFDTIMEQLRTITGEPVDFVINTHLHADHTGGNVRWQGLDAKVIASANARRIMEESNAPGLANITFDDRHMRLYLGAMPIDLYYFGRGHTDGDIVIHLPRERIVFTGDLMPFWDDFDQVIDYASGGSAREWPRTLEKILMLDFDRVVPGHSGGAHAPVGEGNDVRGSRPVVVTQVPGHATGIHGTDSLGEIWKRGSQATHL